MNKRDIEKIYKSLKKADDLNIKLDSQVQEIERILLKYIDYDFYDFKVNYTGDETTVMLDDELFMIDEIIEGLAKKKRKIKSQKDLRAIKW